MIARAVTDLPQPLTHDAKRLSTLNLKIDSIDSIDNALISEKRPEILNSEKD